MRLSAILYLLVPFLAAGYARGQEPVASGLLFSSKTESITLRTSLELFDGRPHKFSGRFSLAFDLSIRDALRFGYILRLIDDDNEEASLVFVNFREDDKYYIDFNTSRTGRNIPMRIHPDMAGTGKWISVRIDFDLRKDRAVIHVDSASYECDGVGINDPARLRIVFGFHGINLDVPAMAVKNIRITERSKLRQSIPLNESSGEQVHNSGGWVVGKVKNPTWLISEHFNWSRAAAFNAQLTSGITYNPFSNEVYIIGQDSLTMFRTDTRTIASAPIEPIPMRIDEAIYNTKTNQTYIYNLSAPDSPDSLSPSIAMLNMETLTLDRTGSPRMGNRLHHHNAFFDPECDTLYIFGGYGNFSYSNRIYRYDPTVDSWLKVPFTRGGDSIYPRFFAASGEGRDDYEILMFGGFGNKSGRQELGGKNLYDLISIDLQTKSARKLWEIAPDSLYVPATNLILGKDKKYFYALVYPHHVASSQLALCRYDIQTGVSEIVSNSIPILSEEIATKAFLFCNTPMNELVAVIREYKDRRTANIRIYTLSTPPISARELVDYGRPRWMTPVRIAGLAAAMLVLAFAVFRIVARRRSKSAARAPEVVLSPAVHVVQIRKSAIYVLGDFLAFDHRGGDVTYRFSAKLRMLFALILFHSKERDTGLSTEKLTATLWPEKEVSEAKNIRGVTINHLRKILEDIRGIELVCENSRWRFTFSEGFYCDYIRGMTLCARIIEAGKTAPGAESADSTVNELVRILTRGPLFPLVAETWMENGRHDFEEIVEKTLGLQIVQQQATGNYDRVLLLIETLFVIDPLNEDMLSKGVAALRKMGRPDRALMLYTDFCTRFKTALGAEYPRSFESL